MPTTCAGDVQQQLDPIQQKLDSKRAAAGHKERRRILLASVLRRVLRIRQGRPEFLVPSVVVGYTIGDEPYIARDRDFDCSSYSAEHLGLLDMQPAGS